MRKLNYLTFILLSVCSYGQVQDSLSDSKKYWSISANGEYGKVLKTNDYLKNYDKTNYHGFSLQLLKETTGERDWEKIYNSPSYGVGVFAYDFQENNEMGYPFGVYATFVPQPKRWGKLRWEHSINFGISFNSNRFNNLTGYHNTSVGSKTNMYISLGTGLYYEIGKYFDIGLNAKLNHMSNGAIKTPNKGLNLAAAQLSLVYHPERKIVNRIDTIPIRRDKFDTFELSTFGGKKNVFFKGENRPHIKLYDGFKYSVFGVEGFYMHQYSNKSAYGIGLGITHDEHYNQEMYVQDSTLLQKKRFKNEKLLLSVIPSYRLMIDRLYINIGAGVYINKKGREYDKSFFFQRVGLQYQITDRLFASFAINAYDLHVANYLEWKLGYTISKKKRN